MIRSSGVTFSLSRYSTVPGVQVSGSLHLFRPGSGLPLPARFIGSVRVGGAKAAHGRLKVGRSTLTGRLSGRVVRGRGHNRERERLSRFAATVVGGGKGNRVVAELRAIVHELPEMPVHGIRPVRQRFTPVDLPRPQMLFEFFKPCHPPPM